MLEKSPTSRGLHVDRPADRYAKCKPRHAKIMSCSEACSWEHGVTCFGRSSVVEVAKPARSYQVALLSFHGRIEILSYPVGALEFIQDARLDQDLSGKIRQDEHL